MKVGVVVGTAGVALNLFEGKAGAVVRKIPTKWDETVEVLIVGSGFAGLAAAAEAAVNGAKSVVILEKMPIYGGNSIINGGEYKSSISATTVRTCMHRIR
jgi:fumarate reductase flavoprotein subunit